MLRAPLNKSVKITLVGTAVKIFTAPKGRSLYFFTSLPFHSIKIGMFTTNAHKLAGALKARADTIKLWIVGSNTSLGNTKKRKTRQRNLTNKTTYNREQKKIQVPYNNENSRHIPLSLIAMGAQQMILEASTSNKSFLFSHTIVNINNCTWSF